VVLAGRLLVWRHPATLLPSGQAVTDGVRLYAGWRRSPPLGLALLVLSATGSCRLLGWLLVHVAAIEARDHTSALATGDWSKLAGGLVVAIAFGSVR
jgi:hypothetical protein